ncbi:ankyrin, partial [Terfezia boudieri ATCC MYA-4762]
MNIVEILIARGADSNTLTPLNNRTALHLACITGHPAIVSYLAPFISGRSRPGTVGLSCLALRDKDHRTAMHFAAHLGGAAVMRVLLKFGQGRWDDELDATLMSPLHLAAQAQEKWGLELLVNGDSETYSARGGRERKISALHLAHHHPVLVKLLVDGGANIMATTPQGWTALALSAKGGYLKSIQFLLDAEPQINHQDKDGFTPLHWAAQNGHSEVVDKLLHKGANPMLKIQA